MPKMRLFKLNTRRADWVQRRGGRGFSLIEIMMAVGLGALVAAAVGSAFSMVVDSQTKYNHLMTIGVIRNAIVNAASNSSAWSRSVVSNPLSMACLQPASTSICPLTTQAPNPSNTSFVLYDASGSIIFDSTIANNGLTVSGRPCRTFSLQGNDACPFRYDLKWMSVCPAAGCGLKPQVMISANLLYKPVNAKMTINTAEFSVAGFYIPSFTNVFSCGSATTLSYSSSTAPTSSLCSPIGATAAAPTYDASNLQWDWRCSMGSDYLNCVSQPEAQCGAANGLALSTAPSVATDLCAAPALTQSPGVVTNASGAGTYYTWNCQIGSGAPIACQTSIVTTPPTAVAGTCGSARGGIYSSPPTTGLCATGTPTVVSGNIGNRCGWVQLTINGIETTHEQMWALLLRLGLPEAHAANRGYCYFPIVTSCQPPYFYSCGSDNQANGQYYAECYRTVLNYSWICQGTATSESCNANYNGPDLSGPECPVP